MPGAGGATLAEPPAHAAAGFGAKGWVVTAALLVPLALLGNPAVALLLGAAITLLTDRPLVADAGRHGTLLLQTAIALLGFRLSIDQVLTVSGDALPLVAGYVLGVLGAGLALGRLIGLERISAVLLSAGTAICGGTAMATLAPILGARAEQLGVAVAIVFLLNAFALLTFPTLGAWLGMSQETFGVFVALTVHDTSSVLATAARYGDAALEVATTVKLGRTLWLIPLAIATSVLVAHARARVRVPGFVIAFLGASLCASVLALPPGLIELAGRTSKVLLVAALFFVGLQFRRSTLAALRGRLLAHALALWGLALAGTLGALRLTGAF